MPHVDPYDHRPTDAELDSWDERFEFTDVNMTAAKMIRTLIRELKAERARNNPERIIIQGDIHGGLGMPAPAIRQQGRRFQFGVPRGGGFTAMNQRADQINARVEPIREYAPQDAEFTQQLIAAMFKTPHEIRPGHRVMTDVRKRGDIPELHGTVIHTKKKGAYPSVKVSWDNGTEGYISGRFLKPSDLPEFTLETMEQDYDVD
jgi:hypothetical protein